MRIEIDTTNKYIVIGATVNAKEFIHEIYELLGDDYVNYSIVKPIESPQTNYFTTNSVESIGKTILNDEDFIKGFNEKIASLLGYRKEKSCNCNPEIEEDSCCGGCKTEESK